MAFAYILTENQESIGYLNFRLTNDNDEILNTPVSDTIFVDTDGSEGYEQLKVELERRYPPVDENVRKYPFLYGKRILGNYRYESVKFYLIPKMQISAREISCDKNLLANLVDYIKENGSMKYGDNHIILHWGYSERSLKKTLNKHGIFVRPVKGILEYNPKRAKKQLAIVKKSKVGNNSSVLSSYELRHFKNDLKQTISIIMNVEFSHYWENSYRKKNCLCEFILFYIDVLSLISKKKSYQKLNSLNKVKKYWKNMNQKQKMEYPKKFRVFMNKEIKIKPPKNFLNPYQSESKINKNSFPLSKYQKDKFYDRLKSY